MTSEVAVTRHVLLIGLTRLSDYVVRTLMRKRTNENCSLSTGIPNYASL